MWSLDRRFRVGQELGLWAVLARGTRRCGREIVVGVPGRRRTGHGVRERVVAGREDDVCVTAVRVIGTRVMSM
jgi:hypothetical protein